MKGKGFDVDGIWIAGVGSTEKNCQRTALFITELMTGQAVLPSNCPAAAGLYTWVEAVLS